MMLCLLDIEGVVEKKNYEHEYRWNANRDKKAKDLHDGKSIYVNRGHQHVPKKNLHEAEYVYEDLNGFQVPVDISVDLEKEHPKPAPKKDMEQGYYWRNDNKKLEGKVKKL